MRLRIFIDYWNFVIAINKYVKQPDYRIDYKKLSPWILNQTQLILNNPNVSYSETRIYLSYNPGNPNDEKLKNFATNFLNQIPGVNVILLERKMRNAPVCPHCKVELSPCPNCGEKTNGSKEKGIDTALATDLMGLAWEGAWDVAVLLSSDRDFIPAVELLNRKGFCVINGFVPHNGNELIQKCWGSIDFSKALAELAYIKT